MTDKLPIPRLRRQKRESIRGRSGRACETCRERKSKCDGGIPACSQCLAQGLRNCIYPERKVIRQEKEIASMRSEIEYYRGLLQIISQEQNGHSTDRFKKTIREFDTKEGSDREISSSRSSSSLAYSEQNEIAHEDFNRNKASRATGFMGNNSEVAWMQYLDLQFLNQRVARPIFDVSSINYRLDHQEISNISVPNFFALPPKALADRLFKVYLENVQNCLPVIRNDFFVAQYNHCYLKKGDPPSRKWLAVLNMIFAIACAFGRLSGREALPEADENVFSSRAKSLSISDNVLYDHSDLQQVQAETLMAFLLLIQSQINRSWKMIGIATRSGISLGLNLEKRIPGLDVRSGEARKQLWWSIHRLESLLSVMTGRVSSLGNASSSASPPYLDPNLDLEVPDISQPTNEIQWTIHLNDEKRNFQKSFLRSLKPSQSLYLFYVADLALISQGIITEVFATGAPLEGLSHLERRIVSFRDKVDFWVTTIHPSLCFQGQIPVGHSRFRSSLALNYYSVCILLSRPSFAVPSSKKRRSPHRSGLDFADNMASYCLQAALGAIAQLPDYPDLAWCYQIPQWWNILHIITQATAILFLDISIDSGLACSKEFSKSGESDVWLSASKALRWLHCLARTSESAERALRFFSNCAHRLAPDLAFYLENISVLTRSSPVSCDRGSSGSDDDSKLNEAIPPGDIEFMNGTENLQSHNFSAEEDATILHDVQDARHASGLGPLAVLDTDRQICDLISKTDVPVEDLLVSMVGSNC